LEELGRMKSLNFLPELDSVMKHLHNRAAELKSQGNSWRPCINGQGVERA